MTLHEARRKARQAAIRTRETRYVVYDGPPDGPHGGYQVADDEDMETFFLCNGEGAIKATFLSDGSEDYPYS